MLPRRDGSSAPDDFHAQEEVCGAENTIPVLLRRVGSATDSNDAWSGGELSSQPPREPTVSVSDGRSLLLRDLPACASDRRSHAESVCPVDVVTREACSGRNVTHYDVAG
jgi:hypothetical protein